MKFSRNLHHILTLFFLLSPFYPHAQNVAYWQQEANYWIEVELDDTNHDLRGNIKIEYTNHSPDTLTEIYMHIWPNAYASHNTAFAKQQLENGSSSFYYAKESEMGYIDSLNFYVDGKSARWLLDKENIDYGLLTLTEPLLPGDLIEITTPFHVRLPKSFSRLGHVRQSYQITQWYPKPAVYDTAGWHPMPYLDQGEFFSEFGDFEVMITLPKNYVVGASGYLQNEEEKAWLMELANKPINYSSTDNEFPESDIATKTLHYKLGNAHDFAWFADKRFNVRRGEVVLPNSGRTVETWAMFTNYDANIWRKSIEYINDGLYYYSQWIGDYPDSIMTVVEGALSAGAGMEYPTITIVGGESDEYQLERVIVHETGHNWFYGYLGSNEREHPWMDEGINSFYENRYFEHKYKDNRVVKGLPRITGFFDLDHLTYRYLTDMAYQLFVHGNKDQPIELEADKYTRFNYFSIVYGKTAIAFDHLKNHLGEQVFDKGMQAYFAQWKFKHPQPDDLQTIMEAESGQDLDWFFEDLFLTTDHLDYAIGKAIHDEGQATRIKVKNKGHIAAPFSISSLEGDSVLYTQWYSGFEKDTTVTFNGQKGTHYKIDHDARTTEYNRQNNTYRNRGLLKKVEPLRFQLFGSVDNPDKSQLFFSPIIGWNHYDKTLLGMAFYNHTIVPKRFEFELAPMLGTGPVTFSGMGRVGYNWNPRKSKLRNINLSVYGKRFTYQLYPLINQYSKVQPTLTFNIRKKDPRSSISETVTLRNVNIWQEYEEFIIEPPLLPAIGSQQSTQYYFVNEARYELENSRVINPYTFIFALEQGKEHFKIAAEANFQITYNKPSKGFFIRIFAAGFPWHNVTSGSIPDVRLRLNHGMGLDRFQKDYLFDELYLGRNENTDFLSQQIEIKDGGFRSMTSFGQTSQWLTAININTTLPKWIPLRPYMSFGAFGQPASSFNMAFEAGIAFFIIPDVMEVNFPLATFIQVTKIGDERLTRSWSIFKNKNDNDNLYRGQNYWGLITFRFNLKPLNPFNVVDEFVF